MNDVMAWAGFIATLVGLGVLLQAARAAWWELAWRIEWRKELRDGLRKSALDGWNTSEIPQGVYIIFRGRVDHPMVGKRHNNHVSSDGMMMPVRNVTGWMPLPGYDAIPDRAP